MGMETARHYTAATPKVQAYRDSWVKLAPYRDGEVNPQRVVVNDPAQMAQQIKAKQWNWDRIWSAFAACNRI